MSIPSTPAARHPRTRSGFLTALGVDSIGNGLFTPVSLLFFTRVAGMPLPTVGLLVSTATLATLPLPPLVGTMVDRYGARNVVLLAQLLQAVGFLLYPTVDSPTSVLATLVVTASGNRIFWCSVFALASELPGAGTDRVSQDRNFAVMGMVQASGFGVGATASGALLALDSEPVYLTLTHVNAITFLVSAVLLVAWVPSHDHQERRNRDTGSHRMLLADRPYLALIAVNTLFALCSIWIGIAVPVYLMDGVDSPSWIVAPVLAVNTVVMGLGQARATRLTRSLSRARALVIAGALWVVWAVAMALALRVPSTVIVPYVVATTLCFTAAELIHAPISNALASAAAPEEARGRYLAAFQYSFVLSLVLGPGLFGLTFAAHPALPWLILAVLATTGAVAMAALERHLPPHAVHGHGPDTNPRPPGTEPGRTGRRPPGHTTNPSAGWAPATPAPPPVTRPATADTVRGRAPATPPPAPWTPQLGWTPGLPSRGRTTRPHSYGSAPATPPLGWTPGLPPASSRARALTSPYGGTQGAGRPTPREAVVGRGRAPAVRDDLARRFAREGSHLDSECPSRTDQ